MAVKPVLVACAFVVLLSGTAAYAAPTPRHNGWSCWQATTYRPIPGCPSPAHSEESPATTKPTTPTTKPKPPKPTKPPTTTTTKPPTTTTTKPKTTKPTTPTTAPPSDGAGVLGEPGAGAGGSVGAESPSVDQQVAAAPPRRAAPASVPAPAPAPVPAATPELPSRQLAQPPGLPPAALIDDDVLIPGSIALVLAVAGLATAFLVFQGAAGRRGTRGPAAAVDDGETLEFR